MSPLDPAVLQAFAETLTKEAFAGGVTSRLAKGVKSLGGNKTLHTVAEHLDRNSSKYDIAGLGGMIGLEGANLAHSIKKDPVTGKRDWGGAAHAGLEGGYLAALAAPVAAGLYLGKKGH